MASIQFRHILILGDHMELQLPSIATFFELYPLSKYLHSCLACLNMKNYHSLLYDYTQQMHLLLYHHHLSFSMQVQIILLDFYTLLTIHSNPNLSCFLMISNFYAFFDSFCLLIVFVLSLNFLTLSPSSNLFHFYFLLVFVLYLSLFLTGLSFYSLKELLVSDQQKIHFF